MPVNATNYYPYASGAGASISDTQWRNFMAKLAPSAVLRGQLNELNPFGDSTGMQVKVDTGAAWVRGEIGEWTGVSVLPIAAVGGIPGGQSRIDRIVCRNDFVNQWMTLDILTGTPAATPTPPALTQSSSVWEMLLAEIGNTAAGASAAITNATTTIAPGMVLDGRWKMTESGVLYQERGPLAATAGSIVFGAAGGIPQGYRHLEINWQAATDQASSQNLNWRANGDTTVANYNVAGFTYNHSGTQNSGGSLGANRIGSLRQAASNGYMKMSNYSGATLRHDLVASQGGTDTGVYLLEEWTGGYINPVAITRLDFIPAAGGFAIGSLFTCELKP